MTLEEIFFTPKEETKLRQYVDSDAFIKKAKEKIISSSKVYSTDIQSTKKLVLSNPSFASLNHTRVLEGLIGVYGADNEEKLRKVVLSFPIFAGLNHTRVLEGLISVYGADNEEKLKKAVLSFPSFAGLNHTRVLRQKSKLGRISGFKKYDIKEIIFRYPTSAGCSYKRDLAIFDIVRKLKSENLEITLKQILINLTKSPYVPNTNRLRISKARRSGTLKEMPKMYYVLKKTAVLNEQYISN